MAYCYYSVVLDVGCSHLHFSQYYNDIFYFSLTLTLMYCRQTTKSQLLPYLDLKRILSYCRLQSLRESGFPDSLETLLACRLNDYLATRAAMASEESTGTRHRTGGTRKAPEPTVVAHGESVDSCCCHCSPALTPPCSQQPILLVTDSAVVAVASKHERTVPASRSSLRSNPSMVDCSCGSVTLGYDDVFLDSAETVSSALLLFAIDRRMLGLMGFYN